MVSKKPVALVVGASRGIGRQVAVDLARNGYAGMSSFAVSIVPTRYEANTLKLLLLPRLSVIPPIYLSPFLQIPTLPLLPSQQLLARLLLREATLLLFRSTSAILRV